MVSLLDKEPLAVSVCVDKRPEVEGLHELDSREDKTLYTELFQSSLEGQWDLDTPRRFTTLSSWISLTALLLEVPATVSRHESAKEHD